MQATSSTPGGDRLLTRRCRVREPYSMYNWEDAFKKQGKINFCLVTVTLHTV